MWHNYQLMVAIFKECLTHPRGYTSFLSTSDGKTTPIRHTGSLELSIEEGRVTIIKRKERKVIAIFQVDGIETKTEALALKQSIELEGCSMLVKTFSDPAE